MDCGDPDLGLVPASEFNTQPANNYLGTTFQIRCGSTSERLEETGNDEGENTVVCREDYNWDFGKYTCSGKENLLLCSQEKDWVG